MQLEDLAIHVTKEGADRCLLCGASRQGKSTAAGVLVDMFYTEYVEPYKPGDKKRGRILISDTKPRWRPDRLADGSPAGRRYKAFLPGPVIPHSRLVEKTTDWDLAWQTGDNVVLLQNHHMQHADLMRWQISLLEKFFDTQKFTQPSLVMLDEGMDFFGPTGNGKYSDIVQRIVRAGGEKGMASLINVQRPITINLQLLTESNYLMLFPIKFRKDLKRLWEMGVPEDFTFPIDGNGKPRKHHFALWRNDDVITRDAILHLP